jgi:hypothetical protein
MSGNDERIHKAKVVGMVQCPDCERKLKIFAYYFADHIWFAKELCGCKGWKNVEVG